MRLIELLELLLTESTLGSGVDNVLVVISVIVIFCFYCTKFLDLSKRGRIHDHIGPYPHLAH